MTVTLYGTALAHERPLRVNLPGVLTFTALSALILSPFFGSLAALIFLVFGLLLIAVSLEKNLQAFLRYWYILLIPLFCLTSVLWSQFPSLTMRYSIQLTVTLLIAIAIGASVTPAGLLRCMFGAYGIGVLGSVLFGRVRDDIGAWLGIFGSKNAFASHISVFTLAAIAVLFDRSASRLLRFSALCGVLAAGPLLINGQSVGAVLAFFPAIFVSLLVIFSRYLSRFQKVVAGALLGTGVAIVAVVALVFGAEIFDAVLVYSGKDVTLTGAPNCGSSLGRLSPTTPGSGWATRLFGYKGTTRQRCCGTTSASPREVVSISTTPTFQTLLRSVSLASHSRFSSSIPPCSQS